MTRVRVAETAGPGRLLGGGRAGILRAMLASHDPPSGAPPARDGWRDTTTPAPVFSTADVTPEDMDGPPSPTGIWDSLPAAPAWDTALLLFVWSAGFAMPLLLASPGGGLRLADWGANVAPPSGASAAWRLLASTFLHATPAHLLSNLVTLALLGPSCVRLFGRSGLWLLYALGGAAASLASLTWRSSLGSEISVSVGGSGVLFALGGAMASAAWRLRRRLPPGRARALGGALLVLLGSGLVAGLTRQATDSAAHLGGAAAGLLLGLLLPLRSAERPAIPLPIRLLAGLAIAALSGAFLAGVVSGVAGRI